MKLTKNKKGFSIVECIVAIVVISIISASAILIFQTASKSSTGRWDNFKTVIVANNALSIFKVSEDVNAFTSEINTRLGTSTALAKDDTQNVVINTTDVYSEYSVESQMTPKTIKTVRVYESGKIQFFSNSIDINKEYTDYLFDISYSSTDGDFASNREIFTNASVYNVYATNKTEGGINSLSYQLAGTDGSNNKNTINITYNYKNSSGATTTTLQAHLTCSDGNSVTYEANSFENYLFEKRYILVPYSYRINSVGDKSTTRQDFTCFVYQVSESGTTTRVTVDGNSKKYLVYKLSGKVSDCENYKSVWYSTGAGGTFNIQTATVTDSGSTTGTISSFSDLSGYSSITWKYYPYLAFAVAFNGSSSNTDITKAPTLSSTSLAKGDGKVNYTDYTVKSGINSNITYATSRNESGRRQVFLYNNTDTLMYKMTGSENAVNRLISTLREKLNFLAEYDVVLYQKDAQGNEVLDSNNNKIVDFTKHRDQSSPITIKTVKFISSGSGSSFSGKIAFYDSNGNEIVWFNYIDEALFNNDANQIRIANNTNYSRFYKGNKSTSDKEETLNNDRQGSLTVVLNNGYYVVKTLYVSGSTRNDTTVFLSHSTDFDANPKYLVVDSEVNYQEVISSITDSAIKTCYSFTEGENSCFIIATFSKASFDASVEPQIKIWLLDTSKLPTIAELNKLANDNPEIQTQNWAQLENKLGTPYIHYKKG